MPAPSHPFRRGFATVRRPWHALLLAAAMALCGCAAAPPAAHDPSRPHHAAAGFRNPHTDAAPKGVARLLQWRWQAWREGLPAAALAPTPSVAPDLAFIHANATAGAAMRPALTWIGHASALAQFGGLNWLVDPMFSDRASPVRWAGPVRAQPPGLTAAQLPRIDAVLISHDHYDHLDVASVRALAAQPGGSPLFVVPLGLKAWLAGHGITRVVELDWWAEHRLAGPAGEVAIMLTPAQHWSGRGLGDRMTRLWGGFAVFAPDFHFYYAGDTGYSPDFAEIGRRAAGRAGGGGFDLALIPIGAYEPRWFMREQHVNPEEALRIHRDVQARRSVGVHWGTFQLADEALDEPPRALAAARRAQGLADEAFVVLAVGQTLMLPPRGASR